MNPSPKSTLRPVAFAVLAGLMSLRAGVAHADEETTPFSFGISHSVLRDDNFSKDEAKRADTVNSTAAQLSFDKAYGRQTYRGSGKVSLERYASNSQDNNSGKDFNGAFSSGIASNWLVSANGAYSEGLNNIQDNNLGGQYLVRNIRKYGDANLSVQYGNGGRWAIVGSQDINKLRYSHDLYKQLDANQRTSGLKALYYSTDLLYFGLGGRVVRTSYPLNVNIAEVKDNNIDLSVNWQVTGVSNLSSVLSRRSSSYLPDTTRRSNGWTGSLHWQYTPHGMLNYGFDASRATGSDRLAAGNGLANQDTTTNTYAANVRINPTAKLGFGLSYGLSQYKLNQYIFAIDPNSVNHNATLSVNYDPLRSVGLACSLSKYSETEGANRRAYDGQSINCSVTFSIY